MNSVKYPFIFSIQDSSVIKKIREVGFLIKPPCCQIVYEKLLSRAKSDIYHEVKLKIVSIMPDFELCDGFDIIEISLSQPLR